MNKIVPPSTVENLLQKSRGFLLKLVFIYAALAVSFGAEAQTQTVARQWNEALLFSIRRDFARPIVHARNLHHISMAMYDAWAVYSDNCRPYFLGDTLGTYICPFVGVPTPANVQAAQNEAISYAAYRLIRYRFQSSPNIGLVNHYCDSLLTSLGYSLAVTSTNYQMDGPAALGNYIAQQVIAYGLQDGSREQFGYTNAYYQPVNPPLAPVASGTTMNDPNRWQSVTLQVFIDQSGNIYPTGSPTFLGAEWGNVVPFSLTPMQKTVHNRNGNNYNVYLDPGPPPLLELPNGGGTSAEWQWNHQLVGAWASHLDTADHVMWDISPAALGNTAPLPNNFTEYKNFYDLENGGVQRLGRSINPKTGQPYTPQIVPRGDYTRILAEFWADGPQSETPPGHWFTILNYVNDQPTFEKRWRGIGPILNDLEWDVRSYFALGGAMHDAAVACWGTKGWYDSARPISAIRYMASQGQCTETFASDFSPRGIPLLPGFTERVMAGDTLAGLNNQNIGKIKIKSWKGPTHINNPATDMAGVGWMLAENWWPYQRPTFVTPPFAGYMSGHSTYSRSAAEVLTLLTGDEYFPGGMGEFHAPMNDFLQFEEGPSQDIILQWATYRDAAAESGLSRIWGGIHPPCDDIVGRKVGLIIGPQAFHYAETFMDINTVPDITSLTVSQNLLTEANEGSNAISVTVQYERGMDTTVAPVISFPVENPLANSLVLNSTASMWTNSYTYTASFDLLASSYEVLNNIDIQVANAKDQDGTSQAVYTVADTFSINTKGPDVTSITPSIANITDNTAGTSSFSILVMFDENANTSVNPTISFPVENPMAQTLTFNTGSWLTPTAYVARYDVADANELLTNIDIRVTGAVNPLGNHQQIYDDADAFSIDTRNADVVSITPSSAIINDALSSGSSTFCMEVTYNLPMNTTVIPTVSFPVENPATTLPSIMSASSSWTSSTTYQICYLVVDVNQNMPDIDVLVTGAKAISGNNQNTSPIADVFDIDTKNPFALQIAMNDYTVQNDLIGNATLEVTFNFNEAMNTGIPVSVSFPAENPLANLLTYNAGASQWTNSTTYVARYNVLYAPDTLNDIDIRCTSAQDLAGNSIAQINLTNLFDIAIVDTLLTIVNEPVAGTELSVYPNPVKIGHNIRIELPTMKNDAVIEITNLQGQLVKTLNINSPAQTEEIATQGLDAGVYLIRLKSGDKQWNIKVVVL